MLKRKKLESEQQGANKMTKLEPNETQAVDEKTLEEKYNYFVFNSNRSDLSWRLLCFAPISIVTKIDYQMKYIDLNRHNQPIRTMNINFV